MFTVMSMSSTPICAPRRATPKKTRLRKRLPACLPNFYTTETTHDVQCMESVKSAVKVPSRPSVATTGRRLDIDGTNHSWSDTEEITFPSQSRRTRRQNNSSPCISLSSPSSSILTSPAFSVAKKGVTYGHNGTLVSCRFCEILESGKETFLYQDEDVVVFRPLAPVVVSHILVVPRRHIRNVSELTPDEATLLRRMREIAAMILREMPRPLEVLAPSKAERAYDVAEDCTDEEDYEPDFKFAFHSPPFNSIDHVHMHAFRTRDGKFGCVGSIKYRTETWWCRSFDEIMTRLGLGNRKQRNRIDAETVESATQKKEHRRRRHHVSCTM
ncbi:hypothetical protein KXD40_003960 [Peronospora effusa]|uniref:HIT domain-containing protein n=1 Tax=Peronospora effusa TaxID=542832 RepID=A0A3M6VX09_9STRA|nr:hypothetical protein DD238_000167 [Peronospora effusa]RQM14907.1 hypothetical protein DD237_003948 [Peronospora effusa]UIZ22939.1 hypothetical protein KXD40_003960 [Peronospora effusa]